MRMRIKMSNMQNFYDFTDNRLMLAQVITALITRSSPHDPIIYLIPVAIMAYNILRYYCNKFNSWHFYF